MSHDEKLGLGLVGAGAFGLFCLEAFADVDRVRLTAAARAGRPEAIEVCDRLSVPRLPKYSDVIRHPDVDVVYVATPPSSHRELVLEALRAGKHVLCEKPLALRADDASEMVGAAREGGRMLATNFVMRHSPAVEIVKRILDAGVLGKVLSASVTNCGSDSGLFPDHWFWDRSLSGGIFIEHGVHFFDMYEHWLGPGHICSAHAESRDNGGMEDRVMCTVRHGAGAGVEGTLVTHYHGFDQIAHMDRTDHRLVCEMGDVHVSGWVPLQVTVDAALDDAGADALAACCPAGQLRTIETFAPETMDVSGRGKPRHVTRRVRLDYADPLSKQDLYTKCVRDLLADQVAWLVDAGHRRKVTEDSGLSALRLAEAATDLAHAGPVSRPKE